MCIVYSINKNKGDVFVMSTLIKMNKGATIANLKKFANTTKFKIRSPHISSFIKQVCDQIEHNNYDSDEYLKKFSKIHIARNKEYKYVLMYKVLEIFLNLKKETNSQVIKFKKNQPTSSFVFFDKEDDEEAFLKELGTKLAQAENKLRILREVINHNRPTWDKSMEKVMKILNGKGNEVIEDELEKVAKGEINSKEGLRLMVEAANNHKATTNLPTDTSAQNNLPGYLQNKSK